jgi:C4-dicarboxylate transporter DctQ subunit
MRALSFIEKFILTISKAIAAFAIAAGVALAFVNVIGRYVFESSFTWAGELTIYLFLWSVFFGAVYCFKKDAHIAVDVLIAKVPPKIAKFLQIISLIVALIYTVAIAYYGYLYVMLYIDLGEVSVDLEIPLWIPYVAVPISFLFSAVVIIGKIYTVFKTPSNKFKIKPEADELMEEFDIDKTLKEAKRKSGGMF